jgi:hypothetical protein
MRPIPLAILSISLLCAAQERAAALPQSNLQAQPANTTPAVIPALVVPAGTEVELALTSPVWAKTAKAEDPIYAQTTFPVAINNQMAIPPGTYVQGEIDSVSKPGIFSPHAQFEFHFTTIIFANGYTVDLLGQQTSLPAQAQSANGDVFAAVASAYVEVSKASDILLDNGSQIVMVFQLSLALDTQSVAAAARISKPVNFSQMKSATLCEPIPGTPGTPDTVIPGSPGTPDTVIPGAFGMPDTVIPGTPATSDTVIPGTPGDPGVSCPGPPVVVSNEKAQQYKESFQLGALLKVSGTTLSAGTYQVTWTGLNPVVQVQILEGKTVVTSIQARVVTLDNKSPSKAVVTRANPDGSLSLDSLRFAGQSFGLGFD